MKLRKFYQIRFPFLVTLILTVLFTAKSSIVNAKDIRISISTYYAPYHFFKKDGSPAGIIYEVLEQIANKHGYEVVMVTLPRKRQEERIITGEEDTFPNALEWTENLNEFVYTKPIIQVRDVIFSRKNSQVKFISPEDLFGKKLISIRGYHYKVLDPYFENGKIKRYDTDDETAALKMLQLNRGDGALIVDLVGKWIIKKNQWQGQFKHSQQYVTNAEFRLIFNKKWTDFIPMFNRELEAMKTDERLKAIIERYK